MADRTEPLVGLSSVEAAARLSAFGPNELPKPKRRSVLAIALECLRDERCVQRAAGPVEAG